MKYQMSLGPNVSGTTLLRILVKNVEEKIGKIKAECAILGIKAVVTHIMQSSGWPGIILIEFDNEEDCNLFRLASGYAKDDDITLSVTGPNAKGN